MSLFPIYHYHVYDDPADRYFGDQLDCFDPWQDLQSSPTTVVIVPKSFRWVNQPQSSAGQPPSGRKPQQAAPPRKFRVQLNVAGYKPETIKTKVENGKVIVEAKQEERQEDGDFNVREFRKSCPLPEHADAEHMTSYITPNSMLVIEVPIKKPELEPSPAAQPKNEEKNVAQFGEHRDSSFDYPSFLASSDFQPQIVDKENNEQQLEMSVDMKNYRPEEIKVSVKNDELIVKGEHRHTDAKHFERSFFFKSTKLPPGTQIEQLQSFLTEDGRLKIQAPFVAQTEQPKPVEEPKKEN